MRFVSLHVATKMTVMKNSMRNYQVDYDDYQRRRGRVMDFILNVKILLLEMERTKMALIYPFLLDYDMICKNYDA